jgi:inorganic pyrophosphatase
MPGVSVPTRIIGALEMLDNGETDTKLIGVIACDQRWKHVDKLSDISPHELNIIKEFFETYKRLQKKDVKVDGFKNKE